MEMERIRKLLGTDCVPGIERRAKNNNPHPQIMEIANKAENKNFWMVVDYESASNSG